MVEVRQTLLKAYTECPRKYQYMLENPRQTTLMLEGSNAHAEINSKNIPEHFKPVWDKYFIEPYYEVQHKASFFGNILTGTVDCYALSPDEKTVYVVDWKLNWVPDDDFQLKTYCVLLKNAYKTLEEFVCYYCSINQGYYKKYIYTLEEIADFMTFISNTLFYLEGDTEFLPKPSPKCSGCLYVAECFKSHFPTLYVNPIQSFEDFKEVANKVFIAEAYIDQVKQQLKDYMINTDTVEAKLNGGRIYLSHTVSLRFGKDRKKGGKDE